MSRLDSQTSRVDFKCLHETTTDTVLAAATTRSDDIAGLIAHPVTEAQRHDAASNRVDLEAVFEELSDAPWQKSLATL